MAAPEPRSAPPPPPPPPSRRRRSGGWLWPLLALIALVLVLALLVRACTDDDDDNGASAAGGDTTAQTQTSGGDDGDGGDDGESDGGTVSLDDLLASGGGSLAEFGGRDVDVTDGNVVSVVPGAGFWLGSTESKVFVEVEDEDGLDDLGLEEGATVSLLGRVEENIEAETYGLRGDDAALYREQGAHIAAQAADVETE